MSHPNGVSEWERRVFVLCNARAEAEETVTLQRTVFCSCEMRAEAKETEESWAYSTEVAALESIKLELVLLWG
jgi:hypothetical protein